MTRSKGRKSRKSNETEADQYEREVASDVGADVTIPAPPTPTPRRSSCSDECKDLDMDTMRARCATIVGVEENITDVRRVLHDLELEFQHIKSDYSERLKVVRKVQDECIGVLEKLTHTEVIDRDRGLAHLVHNSKLAFAQALLFDRDLTTCREAKALYTAKLDEIVKRSRPLEGNDSQAEIPIDEPDDDIPFED